jgi:shikimate kinase
MDQSGIPADSQHSIVEALNGRSIVFVGMMGSGKTAIGRLVASALDLRYFDSDHEIVAAANLEIPEIFELHGEPYFRAGEERVIQRLLADGPAVISLGGGAFVSEATRKEIADKGISIWLTADLDLLMARVMRRPGTRPLLQTADPRATLSELMKKREPVYRLADLHVPSSKISKNHTREAVLAALRHHLFSDNVDTSNSNPAQAS